MPAFSLLISDLHLSEARPDLCQAFVDYCQQRAVEAESLYILGDLCDAWLGDDDDGQTPALVRQTLSELVDSGTAVKLMVGNRDFLMGQQLAEDCGLTLLDDPTVIELYGQRILLLHGDSLCTDDAEYMAFRQTIRDPNTLNHLRAMPLDERRVLASSLREQSMTANASKSAEIMDVNNDAVQSAFAEHGVATMIHGHTHRPQLHDYPDLGEADRPAQRWVLGDWDQLGWEISASATGLDLTQFELDKFSHSKR